jgi:hypothetical protein
MLNTKSIGHFQPIPRDCNDRRTWQNKRARLTTYCLICFRPPGRRIRRNMKTSNRLEYICNVRRNASNLKTENPFWSQTSESHVDRNLSHLYYNYSIILNTRLLPIVSLRASASNTFPLRIWTSHIILRKHQVMYKPYLGLALSLFKV